MPSRPLTESEINLVLSHLYSPRDKCLFVLGCKTGFRISELLSLCAEDILEYGNIAGSVTVRRSNMKGRLCSRTVPLHSQAKEVLRVYLETGVSGKLFPMTRQHAWKILKIASRSARLSEAEGYVSTHSMRKTLGMKVYIVSGKNVVAAQRALGHKSLASTTHYLSIGKEEVDAAILA